MSHVHQEWVDTIKAQQNVMIERLHQFCEINSGSTHIEGLNQMGQLLQKAFAPIADTLEIKKLPSISMMSLNGSLETQHFGDALLVRKRPHLKRRVLLSGHMDTVYPEKSPFQTLRYLDKNHLNGPGVADMKGGLIVMLHALCAFEQSPYAQELGWDVLINADEELGSPASCHLLDELAAINQAALVYEPAMTPTGTLAKNRKGSGKFTLLATGKAAHAGRAFNEGKNAICYLAEALCAIHTLNGKIDGLTINIGLISGGNALNVVPDSAVAKMDVRISDPKHAQWTTDAFHQIIQKLQRPGYTLTLHGDFTRPVKQVNPATKRLFNRIKTLGNELGLCIDWQDSGGCCDGNNLAQHGLAVIDTLGVRGGNIHSFDEYIVLDSLSERATLSALLLMDLANGGLEELKHDAFSKCAQR